MLVLRHASSLPSPTVGAAARVSALCSRHAAGTLGPASVARRKAEPRRSAWRVSRARHCSKVDDARDAQCSANPRRKTRQRRARRALGGNDADARLEVMGRRRLAGAVLFTEHQTQFESRRSDRTVGFFSNNNRDSLLGQRNLARPNHAAADGKTASARQLSDRRPARGSDRRTPRAELTGSVDSHSPHLPAGADGPTLAAGGTPAGDKKPSAAAPASNPNAKAKPRHRRRGPEEGCASRRSPAARRPTVFERPAPLEGDAPKKKELVIGGAPKKAASVSIGAPRPRRSFQPVEEEDDDTPVANDDADEELRPERAPQPGFHRARRRRQVHNRRPDPLPGGHGGRPNHPEVRGGGQGEEPRVVVHGVHHGHQRGGARQGQDRRGRPRALRDGEEAVHRVWTRPGTRTTCPT